MRRVALALLASGGLALLLTTVVATPPVLAQVPGASSAPGADVELDLTVTDKEGAVSNLTKEELQIQDDGKKVEVKSLTPVVARGSAAPGDGREIVIVLDDAGVPMAGTPALQQLASIFASAAGPGDNVSVIRFHNGTDDLTRDRQVSLARIAAFAAGAVPYVQEQTDVDMFKLIAKLSAKLGEAAPHRRKAIICIGSEVVCNPLERPNTAPRDEYPSWVSALSATASNNVLVYAAIPARSLTMGAGLAQKTGAQAFTGPNFTPAVERVYADLSQYYMATYTPEASKKDIRTVTARTTRKNTTIKTRDKRGK